ncbi:hypothetical protein C2E20_1137 [Micractinium conductrix]|uniref:SGNH hydrolase-type esterase domain-containing protein n=1 Tax=Micractinium conductrix TaxID=554055 RepID=A0A2P6VMN3_9CHLO|nr:hypothetical protein C2E20_1137 [Micractinium conductrix]|eukprot:PSC75343.1 hypothetical protein C2E20_1137 [Micractinium conductrix]
MQQRQQGRWAPLSSALLALLLVAALAVGSSRHGRSQLAQHTSELPARASLGWLAQSEAGTQERDAEGAAVHASTPTPNKAGGVPPPLPWACVLMPKQLRRGLSYYGSGARIERLAARLLSGEAITAVTIGGSVTLGRGASDEAATSYAALFFRYLNETFPHRDHQLLNKAISATTSAIFAACTESILPQDTDLAVVEFTFNDAEAAPYTDAARRGFERLLRSLARLPRRPAVIVLHHWAWHFAHGDGQSGGLFYRPAEAQLTTIAEYYDMPTASLRNAAYRHMQANLSPFKVAKVRNATRVFPRPWMPPLEEPGAAEWPDFFYNDFMHPSDTGHKALAELLAGVVQAALRNVALHGELADEGPTDSGGRELPPPMIPGNVDTPASLCAVLERFKPLARAMEGFEYRAERPEGGTFVEQKWGFTGEAPGAWLELAVSTEEAPGSNGTAEVLLGHLRSYCGMGQARVECQSGCSCQPTVVEALWEERTSLLQMHQFAVTQHPECVLRITILDRQAGSDSSSSSSGSGSGSDVGCGTGDGGAATAGNTTAGATAATDSSSSSSSKSSSSSSSSSGASKFQVAALVVTHIHVVLVSSSAQGGLAAAVGRR